MITVSSKNEKTAIISLLTIFIFAGIFYSFYGRVFLDAGFYLNASREVYRGQMPYRDFFFVQGPVYPYVYGLPLLFVGYKVLYARWISLVLGILTIYLAGWTAGKTSNSTGKLIALTAVATVPFHAYFFSSIKLYALTGFLLTAAFACFSSNLSNKIRYTAGLTLALLAAASRLTLVPILLIAVIYVLSDSFSKKEGIPWIALSSFTIIAILLAGPFLLADHKAVIYNLIGIHTSASSGPYLFSFSKQLKVILKLIVFYPVLTIGSGYIIYKITRSRSINLLSRLDWAMLSSIGAVSLVHLTANWFSMGYQSPVMPLTATLTGSLTGRLLNTDRIPRPMLLITGTCILLAWFTSWNKPIWRNDVSTARSLAFIEQIIREHTPEKGKIASCNAVFTLQANRENASEFGGAPFTYTPGWSDEQCERYGGMNNSMITGMIKRREIDALLFEPDSFAIGFPGFYPVSQKNQKEIENAISDNYVIAAKLRNLGNGEMDLIMMIPNTERSAQ